MVWDCSGFNEDGESWRSLGGPTFGCVVSAVIMPHYASQVDRARTMRWYKLQKQADGQGSSLDYVQVVDARAKLGVLRAILAGGLLTPDRVHMSGVY